MNHDARSLRTASLIAGLALAMIVVLAPSALRRREAGQGHHLDPDTLVSAPVG